MSIRACRIVCTAGHPCSLSQTRGATSLDNSWNVCKHTCRDNRIWSVTRIKSVKNTMDWFVEHAALHVPWQRRNTEGHLWGVLAAIQRGITRTIYSAKTDMTLATLCDQQRCLPGTYRLKIKGLKINKWASIKYKLAYGIITFGWHQPLCRSSKDKTWKEDMAKVICCANMWQTHQVRALYLVRIDYGAQTVVGFSKNQLVVHLCQMLQHLSNKCEVTVIVVVFKRCTVSRHAGGLTWSTLRQAVELLTTCSCMEIRSRTRGRRWLSSKAWSSASGICLSSWIASSKQRSLHLFTLLLFRHHVSLIIHSFIHYHTLFKMWPVEFSNMLRLQLRTCTIRTVYR